MDALDPTQLKLQYIGLSDYTGVWKRMQKFTDDRDAKTIDELWIVEHPPVFTQGQAGKSEHILNAGNIPVIQVDRGGQVTYHGPGQIVMYPLIDLKRHQIGIKKLVTGIEESIIQTLKHYNIDAKRRVKAPGVYVNAKKIASLGLRVRKGCTFHGLAFNIRMNLEPFSRINPCGILGLEVTQFSDYNDLVSFKEIQNVLIEKLCNQLNFKATNTDY